LYVSDCKYLMSRNRPLSRGHELEALDYMLQQIDDINETTAADQG